MEPLKTNSFLDEKGGMAAKISLIILMQIKKYYWVGPGNKYPLLRF
jgi:hypothetical protein